LRGGLREPRGAFIVAEIDGAAGGVEGGGISRDHGKWPGHVLPVRVLPVTGVLTSAGVGMGGDVVS
jgi:hypothetical protein